jgi:hypothetical protein
MDVMQGIMSMGMRMLGAGMCTALYFLIGLHIYAYMTVLTSMLASRVGHSFALLWMAIGLTLVYNIIYNHFFAMMVKPGSPLDLKGDEKLR